MRGNFEDRELEDAKRDFGLSPEQEYAVSDYIHKYHPLEEGASYQECMYFLTEFFNQNLGHVKPDYREEEIYWEPLELPDDLPDLG